MRGTRSHSDLVATMSMRKNNWIPASMRLLAALGSTWFAIQILTSYPALFLMFCYPILLAAILEPMKVALWKFQWVLSLSTVAGVNRLLRMIRNGEWPDRNSLREHAVPLRDFCESVLPPRNAGYVSSAPAGEQRTSTNVTIFEENIMIDGETSVHYDVESPRYTQSIGSLELVAADEFPLGDPQSFVRFATVPMSEGDEASERGPRNAKESRPWWSSAIAWYAEYLWKKVLLTISILLCLVTAGRILVILGQIILHTAEQIARDFKHYEKGAQHRVQTLEEWIAQLTEAKFGRRIQVPVNILIVVEEQILNYSKDLSLKVSSYMFQQVVPQTLMTTLFLVFLLWNPVKAEGPRKEVLELCSDYVKVKSALSTLLGFLVGASLMVCGLELYYAAALLVAVANFIPNGALLCSVFPCVFALFDDRKRLNQVLGALVVEVVLINIFAFIVEPLFFGAAIEMHPIPAILGVTFFGYVWGMPGMLISIPLLGAFRLALAAFASKAPDDEKAAIHAMQNFIEGHWTEAATLTVEDGVEEALANNEQADFNLSPEPTTLGQDSPSQEEIDTQHPFSDSYQAWSKWFRGRYEDWKVYIDGLLYLGLVYFLFSSWSDRVFGIYGAPPPVDELQPETVASRSAVVQK